MSASSALELEGSGATRGQAPAGLSDLGRGRALDQVVAVDGGGHRCLGQA